MLLTTDNIPVQVYVGYPNDPLNFGISNLTQIMDGTLDTARWNFDKSGEIVTLNGRNAVGKMLDTKAVNKYPNSTSSAIASMFAIEHGLTPVVTPTSTLAGTFYNQQSSVLSTDTSEWDLLLFLAAQENFIVRVKGKKLLFGPYGTVTGYADQTALSYTWGKDVESLEFERSPYAAKDLVVKVVSYDRNYKNHIVATAKSSNGSSSSSQYTETYIIPGLTRDQAQKKAQYILWELSRSQIIGQMTTAGDTNLAIDRKLSIYGVGQGLSETYYLTRVTQSFDKDAGFGTDCSFSSSFASDESEVA
jgi:phage protein D